MESRSKEFSRQLHKGIRNKYNKMSRNQDGEFSVKKSDLTLAVVKISFTP
jgi:hypothetical protein